MEVRLDLNREDMEKIRQHPEIFHRALFQGMTAAVLAVERTVKRPYLSGQALQVRTGRLRNSITTSVEHTDHKIIGIIGTNVTYGKFWEEGYEGPMQVKEYVRIVKQAFGKPLKFPVASTVKAHTRDVNINARPFIAPAIADNFSNVVNILKRYVREAL